MGKRGFSLLELLVALSVAAALMFMALPAFNIFSARAHTESSRVVLARLVYTARHAAITRNRPVVLCPGDENGCGARDTWHRGTVAFVDEDLDLIRDPSESRVAQVPALERSTVVWRAFRNRGYLKFMPSGYTDWQNGHFLICPEHETDTGLARQLVLNSAGRLYYSVDKDGDGVHEDVRGRPLQC